MKKKAKLVLKKDNRTKQVDIFYSKLSASFVDNHIGEIRFDDPDIDVLPGEISCLQISDGTSKRDNRTVHRLIKKFNR